MNLIDADTHPIAEGRTAEIFAWGPGYVLKLFREWCPVQWVEHEARVAGTISAAGIHTPMVKEIVEINRRRGIVYERVDGISMVMDMKARPWMLLWRARELAELQASYMQVKISGLASFRSSLSSNVHKTSQLSEEIRREVLNLLGTLPDGIALCHGDFHPGNVLITAHGPVVIDWATACLGSPWADVARTSLLLTVGPIGDGSQIAPVLKLLIRMFYQAYLDRMKMLIPDEQCEHKRWQPVVAAARLEEHIEPEREALIEMISAGLKFAKKS